MKKLFIIRVLLAFMLSILFLMPANADTEPVRTEKCAAALVKLQVLRGYEDGSLRLENNITRSEFISLVVRLMGYDRDADAGSLHAAFKDIDESHWAYNNIKVALKYGLVSGYPDNTVRPDNLITNAEVLTVLIRALGYERTLTGEWPGNVMARSLELGVDKNQDLPVNRQLTRGEVAVLIYNSLTVDLNK